MSKRSLRPDPNFDALINKIYPNRDDYNAHQERVLAARLRHSANPGAVLVQRLTTKLHRTFITFCSLLVNFQSQDDTRVSLVLSIIDNLSPVLFKV